MFWRLAQICELIPSKDNVFRAVRLNVTTEGKVKKLRRPLKLLTPLEVNQADIMSNTEL